MAAASNSNISNVSSSQDSRLPIETETGEILTAPTKEDELPHGPPDDRNTPGNKNTPSNAAASNSNISNVSSSQDSRLPIEKETGEILTAPTKKDELSHGPPDDRNTPENKNTPSNISTADAGVKVNDLLEVNDDLMLRESDDDEEEIDEVVDKPPTASDNTLPAVSENRATDIQDNSSHDDDMGAAKAIEISIDDSIPKEFLYENLLAVQDELLVFYPLPFDCPICFEHFSEHEGIILKECLHVFCRDCIRNSVKLCDDVDISCPYRDETFSCTSTLMETEIQTLLGEKEYQLRLKKTLQYAETLTPNAFHCLKPDCPGWCVNDAGLTVFDCPVCMSANCLMCKAIHPGITCPQFIEIRSSTSENFAKSERTVGDMVRSGLAMYCPECTAVVQKEYGCDGLTCTICKTKLCWATKGRRWGPRGVGDTSGGCRCRVNGRCTPSCGNCH